MKNTTLLFFGILLISSCTFAQYGKQKKADALFNEFSFVEASKVYRELLANNYNADYVTRKLADCYFMLRDPEHAEPYYEKAVQQEGISKDYFYNYAVVLRGLGKYEASEEWAKMYKKEGGEAKLVRELKKAPFDSAFFETRVRYQLHPFEHNSKNSDFGAYEHNYQLYFVSARNSKSNEGDIHGWNEQRFLDMYTLNLNTTDPGIKPVEGINSVYHEGPMAISQDGKTMYFSRNNYLDNKRGKDKEGVVHLKIYRAQKTGNTWTDIEELPFNDDAYSVSHPALSPDGKTLYFASDMPGGYGLADIYKAEVRADGSFGKPVNLGPEINTIGNELFPFVSRENSLFFASDGQPGYGLLDIQVAIKNEAGEITGVLNMGEPINSTADDFSFFLSENGVNGYIATNRHSTVGDDDIFRFERILPLMLKGHVLDSVNHRPIANARIDLKTRNGEDVAYLITDEKGYYEINIDRGMDFTIKATHKKYNEKSRDFSSKELPKTLTELVVNLELSPVKDIRVLADLNTIYFDFDKYDIRPDAARELDKIVRLLSDEYPDMVMRIEAHTDSRGSTSYNDRLSIDRANSTVEYLVSQGLSPERILTSQGYGEKRLTNGCEDGIQCEEALHQQNRRTEFIVVKME